MEGVTCAVDHRLQQLIPRPRRRREAGDIVDEAQLVELVALPTSARDDLRAANGRPATSLLPARNLVHHAYHLTRVGTGRPAEGCGAVIAWLRYRPADRLARVRR